MSCNCGTGEREAAVVNTQDRRGKEKETSLNGLHFYFIFSVQGKSKVSGFAHKVPRDVSRLDLCWKSTVSWKTSDF